MLEFEISISNYFECNSRKYYINIFFKLERDQWISIEYLINILQFLLPKEND